MKSKISFIFIAMIMFLMWWMSTIKNISTCDYSDFKRAVDTKSIYNVKIVQNEQVPTGAVKFKLSKKKDAKSSVLYVSDVKKIETLLQHERVRYAVQDIPRDSWMQSLLPMLIVVAVVIILFTAILNRQNMMMGGPTNDKMSNFGKSRAKLIEGSKVNVSFEDVAGLKEEKEELKEVVDFLKKPEDFTTVGARIPKGILLVGPPGTGKTLLAKAIAGEADVPFFSISGSDFVEMFVGVGASRVRDLFESAKKSAPCIVFIDEIDAVARKRGAGLGGSHDEREQTLNQMLVEMDGFDINEGIIVMAATNRVDILDPAIMRPGRFDRKVAVMRPDVEGREAILRVHAKNKPLSDDVNLEHLARTTAGYTGADLENILNEAAILAAKEKKAYISDKDIKAAFIKTGIGTEKRSRVISEKEKKITAYHESGHAILFHVLEKVGPVYTISIIPTGMSAAGYTMPLPDKDEMFITKETMLEDIMVSLGGRIAEEMIFKDVTTGASNDLQKATKTARNMVMKYGMSDRIGLISYGESDEEVFLGKDLATERPYGEKIATEIDEEVKNIIDECYAKAKKILEEHIDVLHSSAKLLIEKEKISGKEFETLFS